MQTWFLSMERSRRCVAVLMGVSVEVARRMQCAFEAEIAHGSARSFDLNSELSASSSLQCLLRQWSTMAASSAAGRFRVLSQSSIDFSVDRLVVGFFAGDNSESTVLHVLQLELARYRYRSWFTLLCTVPRSLSSSVTLAN